MKLQQLITLSAFLFSSILFSQEYDWSRSMGGTSNDRGEAITRDLDGNIYTAGFFQGEADFDPNDGVSTLSSLGGTDIFVQKLTDAGDFEWAIQIGGSGPDLVEEITVDEAGNVYIIGYFEDSVDFDPGAGVESFVSNGGTDIFIEKFDTDGNFEWVRRIGGTLADEGESVSLDEDGNVFICGGYEGTVDFNPGPGVVEFTAAGDEDIFITKLDNDGTFLWSRNIGGISTDRAKDIHIDSSGSALITGIFADTVDFDNGLDEFELVSAGGSNDIFIMKLSNDGDFTWANRSGGTSFDIPFSIVTDTSGNIYTTGSFQESADFDPDSVETFDLISAGSTDIFIQKLDGDGDLLWASQFGGTGFDQGLGITVDSAGNAYATGRFSETVDFDPGLGVNNVTSMGSRDIYILKLTLDGNFDFVIPFGSASADRGTAIVTDMAGCIIVTTGGYDGTIDFNETEDGVSELTTNGATDVFIHKTACEGDPPPPPPYCAGSISFNPPTCFGFSDGSVTAGIGTSVGDVTFTITDMDGTVVNVDNSSTANTLNEGWYFVEVTDDSACVYIDSVFLDDPDQMEIEVSVSDAICFGTNTGQAVVDTVINNTGDYNAISYLWAPNPSGMNGIGEDTLENAPAGTYIITINDANGCSIVEEFTINQPPALEFAELTVDPAFCRVSDFQSGNGVVAAAVIGGVPDYDYLWTELSTGATTINSTWGGRNPGLYQVIATDDNGCQLIDTVLVDSLNPIADFDLTSPQFTSNYQGTAVVDVHFTNLSQNFANPNNPGADTNFVWDFGLGSTVLSSSVFEEFDISYADAGTYQVCLTAFNKNGCQDTKCKEIIVFDEFLFEPVNIFSPNNDGNNDVFTFENFAQSVEIFNCVIVNRFGVQIAELTSITDSWNGQTNGGTPVSDGVYFYVYEGKAFNGTDFEGQGTVQIIR